MGKSLGVKEVAKETKGLNLVRKYTTRAEKVSYGSYFMGQNIFYFLVTMFYTQYLIEGMHMKPALVAGIMLIPKIWDGINDPLFGIIVDKVNLKGGRFKPWIKYSTVIIPITVIAMFAIPGDLSTSNKIIFSILTYMLYDTFYTMCDTPIFALSTAMTNNIQERTLLLTIGRTVVLVPGIAIMVALPLLLSTFGWTKLVVVFSIIGLLLMIPINFTAKERFVTSPEERENLTLKDIARGFFQNKYLVILYGGMLVLNLANISTVFGTMIAKHVLKNEGLFALTAVAAMVPMLLIGVMVPILSKRVDRFKLFKIGLIGGALVGIVQYFVGYGNIPIYIGLSVVRTLFTGLQGTLMFMFSADCLEYGEFTTGKRTDGIVFSIQTFSTKIAAAIAGSIGAMSLALINFDSHLAVQPQSVVDGLWAVSSLVPVVGALLSVPIFLMYKLNDKDVQIMALANQDKLTKEEATAQLSRDY